MGAGVETDDGHLPLGDRGRPAARRSRYELPVASAQVKSAILLAGLYAEGETTVVEPAPTRDHTERMLAAAGARDHAPGERASPCGRPSGSSSARSRCPATSRRPRRSSSPRRSCPARSSTSTASTSTRAAPGLLDVLERMGARITVYNRRRDRRRAGRRPRGALGRARRDDGARPGGAARDRRAAAVRARRVVRARRQPPARRRGAAGEGVRPHRGDRRRAARPRRSTCARPRTASGSAASRPGRGAAGSRAAATTGSRCSARSPVSSRSEGVEIEDAECVAVSFPGFFELLESAAQVRPPHDRRDRRAGRRRQEHGRARARRAARLPLPRHGRDVPRAHLARARARRRRSTTGPRSSRSRASTPSTSAPAAACRSPGTT